MMKKLLIASSIALLALSFQASAAPVPVLEITKQDSSQADRDKMALAVPTISSAQVSGYGQIEKQASIVHDYGLQTTVATEIATFATVSSSSASTKITGVGLYSDNTFTSKIASATLVGNQWELLGVLNQVNHVYGLRIEALGGVATIIKGKEFYSGSYTFNTSPTGVVPIPGAALLFGSAMVGLVGFGKRKKVAALTA